MTTRLGESVELLDRAVAYTRVALADVDEAALGRATPCARWRLGDLLDHMGDSLDAFTEAAGGFVPLLPAPEPMTARATDRTTGRATEQATEQAAARVAGLQQRACALLGAWTAPAPARTAVGDLALPSDLLVGTAGLEIAVHGWDVAQATGRGTPVPEALAARLLEVARVVVTDDDRGRRFGPARPARSPSYADRLLGFLGRS